MDFQSKINDQNNIVPEKTIVAVTEDDQFNFSVSSIVEPLAGKKHRDWFDPHFYFCLPLVIGNQYGFIVKSLWDFRVIWDGSDSITGLNIKIEKPKHSFHQIFDNFDDVQYIKSHFGFGIITLQNRFHFRTPPGINLMTMDPPNYINPNLRNLTAVIETDNLRRDFTFNIKVVVPNQEILIKKGTPLAAFIPIQRYFVDDFKIELANNVFDKPVIDNERGMSVKFEEERNNDKFKPKEVGRLYYRGLDADFNKFDDHQKHVPDRK